MARRHLAVGDIHGCFTALETLRAFAGFQPDDVIITLGDHVNRGPNVRAVIDWLIDWDKTGLLVPIRGNHDIMMLNARNNDEAFCDWLGVGGVATLASYHSKTKKFSIDEYLAAVSHIPEDHWQFLTERLVPSYQTDTHFFVHACAAPEIPIKDQTDDYLYWERFNNPARHYSGKIMVCGHTAQRSGIPATNGHAICIDTCAYAKGWLTCLDVESGKIWQADEKGRTRAFHLNDLKVTSRWSW